MYVFIVDIILKLYEVEIFCLCSFIGLNLLFLDGKLIDGQVIQLEDGSAAYVQHVPIPKTSKYLILTHLPDSHTSVFSASSCLLLL